MSEMLKTANGLALLSRLQQGAVNLAQRTKANARQLGSEAAQFGREAKESVRGLGDAMYDWGTFVPKEKRWTRPTVHPVGQMASPLHALFKNFWDPRITGLDRVARTELAPSGKWFSPTVGGQLARGATKVPRMWMDMWRRLGQDVVDTGKWSTRGRGIASWDNRLKQIGLGGMPGRKGLASGLDLGGHIAGRTIRHTPFLAAHGAAGSAGANAYDTVANKIPELAAQKMEQEHDRALARARKGLTKGKPDTRDEVDKSIAANKELYPDVSDTPGKVLAYGPNSQLTKIKDRMRANWPSTLGLGYEGAREAIRRRLGYQEAQDTPTAYLGDMAEQIVKQQQRNLYRAQNVDPVIYSNYKPNYSSISRYPRAVTLQGQLLNYLTGQIGLQLTPEEKAKADARQQEMFGQRPGDHARKEWEQLGLTDTATLSEADRKRKTDAANAIVNYQVRKTEPWSVQGDLEEVERKEILDRRLKQFREDAAADKPITPSEDVPAMDYLGKLFDTEEMSPYIRSFLYNRETPIKTELEKPLERYAGKFDLEKAKADAEAAKAKAAEPKTELEKRQQSMLEQAMGYALPVGAAGLGVYGAKTLADRMQAAKEEAARKEIAARAKKKRKKRLAGGQ